MIPTLSPSSTSTSTSLLCPALRRFTSAAVVLLLAVAGLILAPATAARADAPKPAAKSALTMKGSDTMVILGQRWAEAYMKAHPASEVQVMGGGSGTGIASLLNGTIEIAMASRPMKSSENIDFVKAFKRKPREIPVALDGITIVVHKDNKLEKITIPQLKAIFRGEIKDWKDIGGKPGPIVVYGRENSSGTYVYFKEHVLDNLDFAASVKTLQGTSALIEAVSKDPAAIAYGGVGYTHEARHVSVAKDDKTPAIEPTEANVTSGVYPLSRNLYFYIDPKKETGDVKSFIEFCRSTAGQKIVAEIGYFPLKIEAAAPAPAPAASTPAPAKP